MIAEADNESHGTQSQYQKDSSWENVSKRWNDPNAPYFYQLCDQYGFYVIAEADNESHGTQSQYQKDSSWENVSKRWNDRRKYDYSNIDIFSRMYPSLEEIQEYMEKKGIHGKEKYLYGGDFQEEVHDGNFCMDGLVFPDSTPHTGLLEYQNVYRPARIVSYDQESGVICLRNHMDHVDLKDFLFLTFFPDSTPHTGLLEYQNVYRPARIVSYDQESGVICLRNHMDHVDLKDFLFLTYETSCDGVPVEKGELELLESICPHEIGSIQLRVKVPECGRCYLKISYHIKNSTDIQPQGSFLGFDEIPLKNQDSRNQKAEKLLRSQNDQPQGSFLGFDEIPLKNQDSRNQKAEKLLRSQNDSYTCAVQVWENDRYVWIKADKFCYTFNKLTGYSRNQKAEKLLRSQNDSYTCAVQVWENDRYVWIKADKFCYTFNKLTGFFESLNREGEELLDAPLELNIWRAPTDNDRKLKQQWTDAGYDRVIPLIN